MKAGDKVYTAWVTRDGPVQVSEATVDYAGPSWLIVTGEVMGLRVRDRELGMNRAGLTPLHAVVNFGTHALDTLGEIEGRRLDCESKLSKAREWIAANGGSEEPS